MNNQDQTQSSDLSPEQGRALADAIREAGRKAIKEGKDPEAKRQLADQLAVRESDEASE